MRWFLLLLFPLFSGSVFSQQLIINDSLSERLSLEQSKRFVERYDSTNRMLASCGFQNYFEQEVFTILYRDGLGYLIHADSLTLFTIDLAHSSSVIRLGKQKLDKSWSYKKFRKKLGKKCRALPDEELKKGEWYQVFELCTEGERKPAYRIYFKNGKAVKVLLRIDCKS